MALFVRAFKQKVIATALARHLDTASLFLLAASCHTMDAVITRPGVVPDIQERVQALLGMGWFHEWVTRGCDQGTNYFSCVRARAAQMWHDREGTLLDQIRWCMGGCGVRGAGNPLGKQWVSRDFSSYSTCTDCWHRNQRGRWIQARDVPQRYRFALQNKLCLIARRPATVENYMRVFYSQWWASLNMFVETNAKWLRGTKPPPSQRGASERFLRTADLQAFTKLEAEIHSMGVLTTEAIMLGDLHKPVTLVSLQDRNNALLSELLGGGGGERETKRLRSE